MALFQLMTYVDNWNVETHTKYTFPCNHFTFDGNFGVIHKIHEFDLTFSVPNINHRPPYGRCIDVIPSCNQLGVRITFYAKILRRRSILSLTLLICRLWRISGCFCRKFHKWTISFEHAVTRAPCNENNIESIDYRMEIIGCKSK